MHSYFKEWLEMMAGYNRHVGGIKELIPLRQRLIACYTAEEALVFVLPADLVHWTKQASQSAQAFAELKSGGSVSVTSGGVAIRTLHREKQTGNRRAWRGDTRKCL